MHDTPQANNITLFNADQFIQSQYGLTTVIIWAIGLLSAGQCSTITGTYAGQFIMEVGLNIFICQVYKEKKIYINNFEGFH